MTDKKPVDLEKLAAQYNERARNKSRRENLLERTRQTLDGQVSDEFMQRLEELLDDVCRPTEEVLPD